MVQEGDYSTTAKNVTQELTDKNNTAWDNGFSFLIGAILIGFFMAGFTLENNPVILFVVLLLLFFGAYAAMHIVNLYEDISAETIDTLKFEEEFPRANFVMSNLVEFIIGGVVLLGLGVFVNNRIG